jgi:two-component system, OmpR family, sensor kinase
MPLRVKLISAVLVLVAAALAVVSVASISALRGYLLDQADQQLTGYANSITIRHGNGLCIGQMAPSQYWSELLDKTGHPVTIRCSIPPAPGASPAAGPAVPASTDWLTDHEGEPATVPSASGGGAWRIVTEQVTYNQSGGPAELGTLVVGRNLADVYQTSDRLTAIDLGASGIALVILAGVGIAVVRASLRPLTEIERTAGAIAGGQLSLRVPDRDPRTEVGSLARSLNTMLTQIENAFRARAASEAAARQSEDRMRRFIADASHELRTPLTSIRGYAEYYRQRGGLDDAELGQLMSRVEEAAARMGVLVEDLLLLARLDQQRPLDRRPVDLLALAAEAVQDSRVIAPDRQIELSVGAGPAFIVLGDEVRLRQIIGNLMSNALTHTPAGTPVEVRVRSGSLAAADGAGPAGSQAQRHDAGLPGTSAAGTGPAHPDAVIFEVADHGPGLAPEQAERVFERFYRADAARGSSTGGTGLGLAIVSALTAAHGGAASVRAAPGEGATFRIALPLAPEAADSDD